MSGRVVLTPDPQGALELTGREHVDMPWCQKCGRPVQGMISWGDDQPFFVQCHGEQVEIARGADGEIPTGLVLFGGAS